MKLETHDLLPGEPNQPDGNTYRIVCIQTAWLRLDEVHEAMDASLWLARFAKDCG